MSLRDEAITARKWFVHEIHAWNPYASSDPLARNVYEDLTHIIYEEMLFKTYDELQFIYNVDASDKHTLRDQLNAYDLGLIVKAEIRATALLFERQPSSFDEMKAIVQEACRQYWIDATASLP